MLKALSLLVTFIALAPAARAEPAFDQAGLAQWFASDISRGRNFVVKNALPRGNTIKYCAGAGCKIKIPYTFTALEIRRAANAMDLARRELSCRADTAACERGALRHGVREMDRIVKESKLSRMSQDEVVFHSIQRDAGRSGGNFIDNISRGQQFLRDCVDQAANGSSFLIVLASNGLVKHHRVIAPGKINLFLQPHFFTRIEELGGAKDTYRFDLYQTPRTGFDKLPGLEKKN